MLTEEQRKKRNQRRRKQRERAAQQERATKHVFYQPHILNGSGPKPCSVCGRGTGSQCPNFAHIALCSGECVNSYADQWRHFGLKLGLGNKIIYDGRLYQFDTNILVKNTDGEVCIEAWNSQRGFSASRLLIPSSQRDQIVQLPR